MTPEEDSVVKIQFLQDQNLRLIMYEKNLSMKDFFGGPWLRLCVANGGGPGVRSLVRELDLTCCN